MEEAGETKMKLSSSETETAEIAHASCLAAAAYSKNEVACLRNLQTIKAETSAK